MSQYLLIRQLRVQGANAISSPLTYGFPAVTAFLGFGHALQRHVNQSDPDRAFKVTGVGIISHRFEMLDHVDGYTRTLQLTGNPLNERGERSSFIEEGRCHLTVSLVLEVSGSIADRDIERMVDLIFTRMKIAGGDLLEPPTIEFIADDRASIRRMMPGYALVERRDLMTEAMLSGDDALQSLHRYLKVQHRSTVDESGNISWATRRHSPGWIVPIATGFHALSSAGTATQSRDANTPHRFAESLVTLGEFLLATRIDSIADLIWRYQHTGDLYACVQSSDVSSTP